MRENVVHTVNIVRSESRFYVNVVNKNYTPKSYEIRQVI
jgi:hypothetical protein